MTKQPNSTFQPVGRVFRRVLTLCVCALVTACAGVAEDRPLSAAASGKSLNLVGTAPPHGLIVHGGAGAGSRQTISPELEAQLRDAMSTALALGYRILDQGGTSLEAVTATIVSLENAEVFNAGKGAVFNATGGHELDASIMDGATLNAGAVAGVRIIRNPILLAQAVMNDSPHVMLSGEGAEQFAQQQGFEFVEPSYFDTERRRRQLNKRLQQQSSSRTSVAADYFGTVGVVALDQRGNLAAGTSTGGMTAKRYGRVGDSPIIGAGTYANNQSCGVSSTGHGEFFIRHVVAYSICARMQHGAMTLADAADQVVMEELVEVEASGGVVAMDAQGNIAWPFNSASMIRAHQSRDSAARVLIFENE